MDSEKEKSNKKTDVKSYLKVVVPIVVVLLIIFGFVFLNNNKSIEIGDYNNFKFYKENNLWYTHISIKGNEMIMPFKYHPTKVEELYVNPYIKKKILNMKKDDKLILTMSENENATSVVASINIARLYKHGAVTPEIHGGLYDENFNLTEYLEEYNKTGVEQEVFTTNCKYASDSFVVVKFMQGNITKMDFLDDNPNCIVGVAENPEDFRRLADKLSYMILGVIR